MEKQVTRRQLIGMLREMGVQGVTGETLESLEAILKDENRKRWLKDATDARNERSDGIVRRRRKAEVPSVPEGESEPGTRPGEKESDTGFPNPMEAKRMRETAMARYAPSRVETHSESDPTPRHGAPVFDRTADVEKSVLRRAGGRCELCDEPEIAGRQGTGIELEACSFAAPEERAVKNIKTVAVLCQVCAERIRMGASQADIKKLTRKARGKIISHTAVSKKKPAVSKTLPRPARHENRRNSGTGNKKKRD